MKWYLVSVLFALYCNILSIGISGAQKEQIIFPILLLLSLIAYTRKYQRDLLGMLFNSLLFMQGIVLLIKNVIG